MEKKTDEPNWNSIVFENPPLVEVALGLVFANLPAFKIPYFGLFWKELGEEYSQTQTVDPILAPNTVHQVGEVSRIWYLHSDQAHLLQLQNDRLITNWRRIPEDAPYPKLSNIYPVFEKHILTLEKFIGFHALGNLRPMSCQLTYTNHVPIPAGTAGLAEIAKIFPDFRVSEIEKNVIEPVGASWRTAYKAQGSNVTVSVNARTAQTAKKNPVLALDLQVEGAVESKSECEQWFKKANSLAIQTFVRISEENVQEVLWKRLP